MHAAAKRVVRRLASTYAESWVAMHRIRPLANECGLEVSVPQPYVTLFPDRWDGSGDHEAWDQEVIGAVRGLAEDLSEKPVSAVAKLIATADSEAREAGITWPRLTPKLVEAARHCFGQSARPSAGTGGLRRSGRPTNQSSQLSCRPTVTGPRIGHRAAAWKAVHSSRSGSSCAHPARQHARKGTSGRPDVARRLRHRRPHHGKRARRGDTRATSSGI